VGGVDYSTVVKDRVGMRIRSQKSCQIRIDLDELLKVALTASGARVCPSRVRLKERESRR